MPDQSDRRPDHERNREWRDTGSWERERRWAGEARREPYPAEWGPGRNPEPDDEPPLENAGRADWGPQGRWGAFGNRTAWTRGGYSGGMGAYGGGMGTGHGYPGPVPKTGAAPTSAFARTSMSA